MRKTSLVGSFRQCLLFSHAGRVLDGEIMQPVTALIGMVGGGGGGGGNEGHDLPNPQQRVQRSMMTVGHCPRNVSNDEFASNVAIAGRTMVFCR